MNGLDGLSDEVTRSVVPLVVDGRPAHTVELSRTFATSVNDLWDAISQWFQPVTGNLETGVRYQFEGNAGGTITACEKPSRLAATWEWGEDISWVEVNLAVSGAGARLTLSHTAHVTEHWRTYGPGATGVGWELALLGLATHLASSGAPMPEPSDIATAPVVGKSSRGWRFAAIEAGTDTELARAAAARTFAFYTGQQAEFDE